jgi:hypothetical protein
LEGKGKRVRFLGGISFIRFPVLTGDARRATGGFRRQHPPKPALKVSIKLNCPSNPEFFCKIHAELPKMSDLCAVILSMFLLFSYT